MNVNLLLIVSVCIVLVFCFMYFYYQNEPRREYFNVSEHFQFTSTKSGFNTNVFKQIAEQQLQQQQQQQTQQAQQASTQAPQWFQTFNNSNWWAKEVMKSALLYNTSNREVTIKVYGSTVTLGTIQADKPNEILVDNKWMNIETRLQDCIKFPNYGKKSDIGAGGNRIMNKQFLIRHKITNKILCPMGLTKDANGNWQQGVTCKIVNTPTDIGRCLFTYNSDSRFVHVESGQRLTLTQDGKQVILWYCNLAPGATRECQWFMAGNAQRVQVLSNQTYLYASMWQMFTHEEINVSMEGSQVASYGDSEWVFDITSVEDYYGDASSTNNWLTEFLNTNDAASRVRDRMYADDKTLMALVNESSNQFGGDDGEFEFKKPGDGIFSSLASSVGAEQINERTSGFNYIVPYTGKIVDALDFRYASNDSWSGKVGGRGGTKRDIGGCPNGARVNSIFGNADKYINSFGYSCENGSRFTNVGGFNGAYYDFRCPTVVYKLPKGLNLEGRWSSNAQQTNIRIEPRFGNRSVISIAPGILQYLNTQFRDQDVVRLGDLRGLVDQSGAKIRIVWCTYRSTKDEEFYTPNGTIFTQVFPLDLEGKWSASRMAAHIEKEGSQTNVASKCTGNDCTIEGQMCLPGTEGASGKTWKCINKKWVEQPNTSSNVANVASKCTGNDCTIEGQMCLPGSEGASGKTWKCINKKWVEQPNQQKERFQMHVRLEDRDRVRQQVAQEKDKYQKQIEENQRKAAKQIEEQQRQLRENQQRAQQEHERQRELDRLQRDFPVDGFVRVFDRVQNSSLLDSSKGRVEYNDDEKFNGYPVVKYAGAYGIVKRVDDNLGIVWCMKQDNRYVPFGVVWKKQVGGWIKRFTGKGENNSAVNSIKAECAVTPKVIGYTDDAHVGKIRMEDGSWQDIGDVCTVIAGPPENERFMYYNSNGNREGYHFNPFSGDSWKSLGNKIVSAAKDVGNFAKNSAEKVGDWGKGLGNKFKDWAGKAGKGIVERLVTLGNAIGSTARNLCRDIANTAMSTLNKIKDALKEAAEFAKRLAEKALEQLKKIADALKIFEKLRDIPGQIMGIIWQKIKDALNAVKDVVFNFIKDVVIEPLKAKAKEFLWWAKTNLKKAIQMIMDALNPVVSRINESIARVVIKPINMILINTLSAGLLAPFEGCVWGGLNDPLCPIGYLNSLLSLIGKSLPNTKGIKDLIVPQMNKLYTLIAEMFPSPLVNLINSVLVKLGFKAASPDAEAAQEALDELISMDESEEVQDPVKVAKLVQQAKTGVFPTDKTAIGEIDKLASRILMRKEQPKKIEPPAEKEEPEKEEAEEEVEEEEEEIEEEEIEEEEVEEEEEEFMMETSIKPSITTTQKLPTLSAQKLPPVKININAIRNAMKDYNETTLDPLKALQDAALSSKPMPSAKAEILATLVENKLKNPLTLQEQKQVENASDAIDKLKKEATSSLSANKENVVKDVQAIQALTPTLNPNDRVPSQTVNINTLEKVLNTTIVQQEKQEQVDLRKSVAKAEGIPSCGSYVGSTKNISQQCYNDIWAKKCKTTAPVMTDWHRTQSMDDLIKDTETWATLQDLVHVEGCYGKNSVQYEQALKAINAAVAKDQAEAAARQALRTAAIEKEKIEEEVRSNELMIYGGSKVLSDFEFKLKTTQLTLQSLRTQRMNSTSEYNSIQLEKQIADLMPVEKQLQEDIEKVRSKLNEVRKDYKESVQDEKVILKQNKVENIHKLTKITQRFITAGANSNTNAGMKKEEASELYEQAIKFINPEDKKSLEALSKLRDMAIKSRTYTSEEASLLAKQIIDGSVITQEKLEEQQEPKPQGILGTLASWIGL